MTTNITNSNVSNFPAIALILLAVFLFAARAAAQSSTTPQQVITRDSILQVPTQTSQELGLPPVADNRPANNNLFTTPPPTLQNFEQNFAGFRHAQTLPFLGVETLLGFEYKYQQQTRNDVQRTSDIYTGDVLAQIGLGKGFEFYGNFPFQTYNDTTLKDRTGQDSYSRNGNGDLRLGIQYNFLGNAGGPYYLSASVDGLIGTRSYSGSDFPRFLTLGDTNTDTGHRDNNHNTDNYGGGVSVQASMDLPRGWQVGINSGVMIGHPDCCCCDCCCVCACFDNRFNLTKTFCDQWAVEATVATSVSTARRSDVQAVVLGGFRWTPTPWLGLYAGPTWNATQSGDNIGGMFQASVQWDKIPW